MVAFEPDTISFIEFAGMLRQKSRIWIYYNPEWVKDIEVILPGDSVNLGILLDRILNPAGIKYLQTDGNQIFITGRGAGVDVTQIKSPNSGNTRDTAGTLPGIENFSRYSYERAITRVTIGEKGKSQGSGKSYLSGRITNSSNGEPVIGAAVVDQGTGAGIISDAEGSYVLPVKAGTSFNLKVSCLGMENKDYLVEMNGSGILNIEMDSKLIGMKEVVVMSDRNHNVRGMQMGFQRIGKEEMKTIPVVLGERDILKIANLDDAELYKRSGSFYDVTTGMHLIGKNNSSWQLFGYFSQDRLALSTTSLYRYGNLGGSIA